MERNTDNIECFLFELNELLQRHKATIHPNGGTHLNLSVGGQHGAVSNEWEEIDGRWKPTPHRMVLLGD